MNLSDLVNARLHPSSVEGVALKEVPLSTIIEWQKKENEMQKKIDEMKSNDAPQEEIEDAKEKLGEKLMFAMVKASVRTEDGLEFDDLVTPKDLSLFTPKMLTTLIEEIRLLYDFVEEDKDGKKE